uniref:epoxyqueuosine reductase QueH n=1 Tax=Lachnospira sp. TaxID=2049031 RepID=UPI00402920E4
MAVPFENRNFQKELEKKLQELQQQDVKHLLLHSCCAPCSSYVIEYLSRYFQITVFYYNPNISAEEEYRKRVLEQQRFIKEFPTKYPVDFVEGDYEPRVFFDTVKGYEQCKEGGERCFLCYELRLKKTAQLAAEKGYDYFTTTLTISPLKNSVKLNEIGLRLGEEYGVPYLLSDYKKKEGYKRSIELSKEYGLYRQNYCGCAYSR